MTFVDIAERKSTQEALRRAHEEAELFINAVPSILIGISHRSNDGTLPQRKCLVLSRPK